MVDVVLLVVDGSLGVDAVEEVVLELVVGSDVVDVVEDVVLALDVGSGVVDVVLLVVDGSLVVEVVEVVVASEFRIVCIKKYVVFDVLHYVAFRAVRPIISMNNVCIQSQYFK